MPFLENLEAKIDEEKKQEVPVEKIEPTLKDILASPGESRLFGEYLKKDENDELGGKLFNGEAAPEDLKALLEKRKGFLEIRERAKGMKDKLSAKEIEKMIAVSPALKEVAKLTDAGNVHEIFSKQLDEMAITDPERFANLEEQAKLLDKARFEIQKGNWEIEKICKENGFTEDEYMAAIQNESILGLDALVKSKLNTFRRVFTTKKSIEYKADSIDKRKDIKDLFSSLNENRNQMGGVLQKTLFENEGLREVLAANVIGEKLPEKNSFAEARETVWNTVINKDMVKKEYEAWKDRHEKDFNPEDGPKRFSEEYASKNSPKKIGFWSSFFRSLFSKGIQNALQ